MEYRIRRPGGGGRGGEKHEIYMAAFGSLLFYDLFFTRPRGGMPPSPPGSTTEDVYHPLVPTVHTSIATRCQHLWWGGGCGSLQFEQASSDGHQMSLARGPVQWGPMSGERGACTVTFMGNGLMGSPSWTEWQTDTCKTLPFRCSKMWISFAGASPHREIMHKLDLAKQMYISWSVRQF